MDVSQKSDDNLMKEIDKNITDEPPKQNEISTGSTAPVFGKTFQRPPSGGSLEIPGFTFAPAPAFKIDTVHPHIGNAKGRDRKAENASGSSKALEVSNKTLEHGSEKPIDPSSEKIVLGSNSTTEIQNVLEKTSLDAGSPDLNRQPRKRIVVEKSNSSQREISRTNDSGQTEQAQLQSLPVTSVEPEKDYNKSARLSRADRIVIGKKALVFSPGVYIPAWINEEEKPNIDTNSCDSSGHFQSDDFAAKRSQSPNSLHSNSRPPQAKHFTAPKAISISDDAKSEYSSSSDEAINENANPKNNSGEISVDFRRCDSIKNDAPDVGPERGTAYNSTGVQVSLKDLKVERNHQPHIKAPKTFRTSNKAGFGPLKPQRASKVLKKVNKSVEKRHKKQYGRTDFPTSTKQILESIEDYAKDELIAFAFETEKLAENMNEELNAVAKELSKSWKQKKSLEQRLENQGADFRAFKASISNRYEKLHGLMKILTSDHNAFGRDIVAHTESISALKREGTDLKCDLKAAHLGVERNSTSCYQLISKCQRGMVEISHFLDKNLESTQSNSKRLDDFILSNSTGVQATRKLISEIGESMNSHFSETQTAIQSMKENSEQTDMSEEEEKNLIKNKLDSLAEDLQYLSANSKPLTLSPEVDHLVSINSKISDLLAAVQMAPSLLASTSSVDAVLSQVGAISNSVAGVQLSLLNNKQLFEELTALRETNDALSEQLKSTELALNDSEHQCQEAHVTNESMRRERDLLLKRIDSHQANDTSDNNRLVQLEKQNGNLREERVKLSDFLKAEQSKLVEATGSHSREIKDLKFTIEGLKEELSQSEGKLLSKEMDFANRVEAKLKRQAKDIQQSMRKAAEAEEKASNAKWQQQLNDLKSQLKKKQEENSILANSIARKDEHIRILGQSIEELQDEIDRIRKASVDSQDELQKLEARLSTTTEDYRVSLEAKKQDINNLENTVASLGQCIEASQKQNEEARASLPDMQRTVTQKAESALLERIATELSALFPSFRKVDNIEQMVKAVAALAGMRDGGTDEAQHMQDLSIKTPTRSAGPFEPNLLDLEELLATPADGIDRAADLGGKRKLDNCKPPEFQDGHAQIKKKSSATPSDSVTLLEIDKSTSPAEDEREGSSLPKPLQPEHIECSQSISRRVAIRSVHNVYKYCYHEKQAISKGPAISPTIEAPKKVSNLTRKGATMGEKERRSDKIRTALPIGIPNSDTNASSELSSVSSSNQITPSDTDEFQPTEKKILETDSQNKKGPRVGRCLASTESKEDKASESSSKKRRMHSVSLLDIQPSKQQRKPAKTPPKLRSEPRTQTRTRTTDRRRSSRDKFSNQWTSHLS